MVLLITSSLLGAVNFIATIIQLRAPGMTWMRMPFFVWAQFVTGVPAVAGFSSARSRGGDAVDGQTDAGPASSCRAGWWLPGKPLAISGGGSPLLWQHLFWFLGHPEVYVLILPGHGNRLRNHRQQHPQAALGL